MRRCDNCKCEILFDDAQFCEHCGATLAPAVAPTAEESDEFVVTESASDRAESGPNPKPRPRQADDLGLQSSAEVVQDLNLQDDGSGDEVNVAAPLAQAAMTASNSAPSGDPADNVKRLSPDQVKSIEKNMYSSTDYLTEDEKRNLLRTVKAAEQPNQAAASINGATKTDTTGDHSTKHVGVVAPAAAKRGRGIAYYMKNYIQVRGDIDLRDNDEIQINNQSFLLRRKRLSPKVMLGLVGSGFVLCLFIIGSLILSNPGGSKGQIVGLVLDANSQPYLMGATVNLPEIGKTFSTNSQGFFRTDRIPPGSYRVEYVMNGQKVGADYATVASGEITTLSLKPTDAAIAQQTESVPEDEPARQQPAPVPAQRERVTATSGDADSRRSQDTRKAEFGRITVAANVDNARFTLDGNVIGAGNTTFGSIKPGQHSYIVSKEGFVPVGGTITLEAGEARTIEVTLTRAPESPEAPNTLASAQSALRSGDYNQAVAIATQQIQTTPGKPELFVVRAEALAGLGKKQPSSDDYCKAAELYHGKNNAQAMTCYNLALKQSPKSVAALLARGNLYLDRGEDIAAIADFESVINLDKRNAIAFLGLGEARYNQGNHDQAIRYFKEARSLSPDDPYVYQYLMLAYLGDDDLKNVKKSYDKFMELSDQSQKDQLQSDSRFNAVLRVVAHE